MKKEPERLEMDLAKIFLTPPNTMKEKITLILMMVVVFVMFFGPVVFTEISPIKGAVLSALPALSISWGGWYYSGVCSEKENFLRLRIRR
ncbi:hypothetical protein [Blautia sp.]|uniref:hypothetical protein n=1 Tax=Blautia sp. TaxID=1955243 RepID=UPI002632E5AB|nr:hypothetical protein [Blautia sp.]